MLEVPTVGDFVIALGEFPETHVPGSMMYRSLEFLASCVAHSRGDGRLALGQNMKLGEIDLGTVSVTDLFELRELIVFSLYASNQHRYSAAADLGANIGIHSIFMSHLGWAVDAYEPDPVHFQHLQQNIAANSAERVNIIQAAVSTRVGTAQFVRVLGNTTSSHLRGSKLNPYGLLQTIEVVTEPIGPIMTGHDFVKMDIEGSEGTVIQFTEPSDWSHCDVLCEVGSRENAKIIFEHCNRIGVKIYAQSNGWGQVFAVEKMPEHYSHGSIFISKRNRPFEGSPK